MGEMATETEFLPIVSGGQMEGTESYLVKCEDDGRQSRDSGRMSMS